MRQNQNNHEKLLFDNIIYDNVIDFFNLEGNCNMTLSAKGTIEVCKEATRRNLPIASVEGGK